MQMKKIGVLGIIAVGILCFAGCNGSNTITTPLFQTNKLKEAYDWIIETYPSVTSCFDFAEDGSFISVDTNPYDLDDYFVPNVFDAVEALNDKLGLPDYVWEEMLQTSAMDGRLSETANGITVTWKYHPDNGLEATYRNS